MGWAEQRDSTVRVRLAGIAVIALHCAYAAATLAGFMTLARPDAPISDPWFAIMEVLIILIAVPVIIYLRALGGVVERAQARWMRASVALAALTFALSVTLHAVILAIGRDHPLAGVGGPLAFTWPSVAYGVDILAWDGFFALALVCCAIALKGAPGMTFAARIFMLAGLVALFGWAGPVTGDMALRNVGIIGYAVIFPVAVFAVIRALDRVQNA